MSSPLLELQGRLSLRLDVYPRDERRFSVHMWLSSPLGGVATVTEKSKRSAKTHHRHHPCLHHTAPGVHVVHLPAAGGPGQPPPTGTLSVELSLSALGWYLTGAHDQETLLRSSLNVDVFNHVLNSHKEDTINQCGSAIVPLAMLAFAANNGNAVSASLSIPGERARQMTRGELIYPALAGNVPRVVFAGQGWSVVADDKTAQTLMLSVLRPSQELLQAPIERWSRVFSKLKPRYKCMRGINAFFYDARLCREPVFGFVCRPPPQDSEEFFTYILGVVLKRVGATESDFLAAPLEGATRSTLPERVLTEVIGSAVHCMPYLMDQIGDAAGADGHMHRRNIESFDFCRMLLKLDCEDGAMEAILEFMSLVALAGRTLPPGLRRLVEVAQMYVPFLWLVGVSSIEINEERMSNVDDMAAHMHMALVPWNQWNTWTADDRKHRLARPAWATDDAVRRSADAPGVLLVEGTGFLDGTGDDATLDARTTIYNIVGTQTNAEWENARKEYGFSRGAPSHFYKLVVVAYSPVWAAQGYCGFVPTIAGDESKYGVRFQDINAHQRTAADRWGNIRFNALPPLTAQERAVIARIDQEQYPLAPLPLPTDKAHLFYRHSEPVADTLRKALAQLVERNRGRPSGRLVPVRWYLSYANMTPAAVQTIVSALGATALGQTMTYSKGPGSQKRSHVSHLLTADVTREDIMTGLGAYHIELLFSIIDAPVV